MSCKETTKVIVFIEKLQKGKDNITFQLGKVNVQSTPNHLFEVFEKSTRWVTKTAENLEVGDTLLVPVPLLEKGYKILCSDEKGHIIKGEIK